MSTVRIGQISGSVDLVRLNFVQQFSDYSDVLFTQRLLLDGASLVERQFQEVNVVGVNTGVTSSGSGMS